MKRNDEIKNKIKEVLRRWITFASEAERNFVADKLLELFSELAHENDLVSYSPMGSSRSGLNDEILKEFEQKWFQGKFRMMLDEFNDYQDIAKIKSFIQQALEAKDREIVQRLEHIKRAIEFKRDLSKTDEKVKFGDDQSISLINTVLSDLESLKQKESHE